MAEIPLWTVDELVAATGGRIEGDAPAAFPGVSIDTRTMGRGEIFVAIRGESRDGHEFAARALRAGAGIAVVSRPDEAMRKAGALLVVDDPLEALEAMGAHARARTGASVIAVTGSVGKTGTKEALRLCLSATGPTHASAASYNNQWGVPLSLARMPAGTRFGVFEIGMNHPGEITPLVKLVRPHIAVVTTVAPVHLGYFDSVEAIADAKAEIFSGLEPGGAAVVNRDNPYFERLAAAAERVHAATVVSFGEHAEASSRLEKLVLGETFSTASARILGEEIAYKLGAPGKHVALNSLAVLTVVKLAGADLARAGMSLRELRAPKGRGQRFTLKVGIGEVTVIDESYNANPASMRAALELLRHTQPGRGGRRIAVIGDMLELGAHAQRLHAELSDAIDAADVDAVYACGPSMMHLWNELRRDQRAGYAESSEDLCDELVESVRAGDVIMIKGSLASRMALVVDALRARYEASATAA